jgi:hypothetical protein
MPERSKGKRIPEEIIVIRSCTNAVTIAVAAFFLSLEKVIKRRDFRLKAIQTLKKGKRKNEDFYKLSFTAFFSAVFSPAQSTGKQ